MLAVRTSILKKRFLIVVCPEHQSPLEKVEEENYFFRLSAYQDELIRLIETEQLRIVPATRKNEMLAFAMAGLHDFSISRSRERAGNWGIPVPGDSTQVMYVWYDALANYITALDYADEGERLRKYWIECNKRIHVIGKGINRFHTLYWPAMLLSAGLPIPHEVFVHGYLTVNGQKISKSLGNVVDPIAQVEKYGIDTFRYYSCGPCRHLKTATIAKTDWLHCTIQISPITSATLSVE